MLAENQRHRDLELVELKELIESKNFDLHEAQQAKGAALAQCQALLDRAKADGNTQANELSSMARERDDLAAQHRQTKQQAAALQDDLSVMQRAAAQRKDELLKRDARIQDLEQEAQMLAENQRHRDLELVELKELIENKNSALTQCQALLDKAKADGNAQANERSSMARERDDLAAQLRQAKEQLGHSSEQATALKDDLSVMQRAAAQRKDELLNRDARIQGLEQEAQVLARKSKTLEHLAETLKHELEQKDMAVEELAQLKFGAEEHASSVAAARQHDLREIDVLKKERDDLRSQLASAAQKVKDQGGKVLHPPHPIKLAAPPPVLNIPQAPRGPANSHSQHSSRTTLASSPAGSAVAGAAQPVETGTMVVARCGAEEEALHDVEGAHTHVQQLLVSAVMEGEDFCAEQFASELILEARQSGLRSRRLSSSPPPPAQQGPGGDKGDRILCLPAPLPTNPLPAQGSSEEQNRRHTLRSSAAPSARPVGAGEGRTGRVQASMLENAGAGRAGSHSSSNAYCSQASASVSETYCSVRSDSSAEALVFDQAFRQPLPISTKLQKVEKVLQEADDLRPPDPPLAASPRPKVSSNRPSQAHGARERGTELDKERERQRERERILTLEREEREYEEKLFGPGKRPTSPALADMLAVSFVSCAPSLTRAPRISRHVCMRLRLDMRAGLSIRSAALKPFAHPALSNPKLLRRATVASFGNDSKWACLRAPCHRLCATWRRLLPRARRRAQTPQLPTLNICVGQAHMCMKMAQPWLRTQVPSRPRSRCL